MSSIAPPEVTGQDVELLAVLCHGSAGHLDPLSGEDLLDGRVGKRLLLILGIDNGLEGLPDPLFGKRMSFRGLIAGGEEPAQFHHTVRSTGMFAGHRA